MPVAELSDASLHYQLRWSGPPALGIMGFALDQRFWAAQIPAVTATHTFVTFDNRGVGRSQGEAVTTIEQLAADAVAVLDHAGIERATLIGVSMGGAVAQRVALDHPERVDALVLAVTWARPIEFMRRQNAIAELLIRRVGVEALIESTLVRMFTPRFFEVGEEAIDRMVRAFLAESGPGLASPEILLGQLEAISRHDVLTRLGDISVPTLVMGARMDMLVPYFASEEIAAAVPGARLVSFDSGHGCMVEEMDAFNARLGEFLAEQRARA